MELVRVALVMSTLEADLIAARLRSEGIDAVVLADTAGGAEPQLAAVRGVRVMVRPEDEVTAAMILEDVVPADDGDPDEPDWSTTEEHDGPPPRSPLVSGFGQLLALALAGVLVVGAVRLVLIAFGLWP